MRSLSADADGNVIITSDIDGRDVSEDGAKLDSIEHGADVTHHSSVTDAGALMDSEVANLAQVKAFDSSDYATAAQGTTADNALPKSGGAMTGPITTNSTFDGVDVGQLKADFDNLSPDIVSDTSPQLGGALDVNGHSISFGDSEKARFGNADDLEIYHSGTTSFIRDTGEGDLQIFANDDVFIRGQSTNNYMARFAETGAVELYHNNSKKIETASSGISVSGNVTVTGTVDGRDVATDGTKLDGIETGATADQTKADIDALNIDADTLDGQQGSYYTNYADTAVSNLVDSSPAALNTLNELANALGDDPNFATTMTNAWQVK